MEAESEIESDSRLISIMVQTVTIRVTCGTLTTVPHVQSARFDTLAAWLEGCGGYRTGKRDFPIRILPPELGLSGVFEEQRFVAA